MNLRFLFTAALFLLCSGSGNATTYTYQGNAIAGYSYTCSLASFCAQLDPVELLPLIYFPPSAFSADVVLNFDSSLTTGTFAFPGAPIDSANLYYSGGLIAAYPQLGYPFGTLSGQITLDNGKITSWVLSAFLWVGTPPSTPRGYGYFANVSDGGDSIEFMQIPNDFVTQEWVGSTGGGIWSDPQWDNFSAPLPAALPLFLTGLGALGLMGWRKRMDAVTAWEWRVLGVGVRRNQMITEPKHPKDRDKRERRRDEEALDEALKNTFPASDPISIEQPMLPAGNTENAA